MPQYEKKTSNMQADRKSEDVDRACGVEISLLRWYARRIRCTRIGDEAGVSQNDGDREH